MENGESEKGKKKPMTHEERLALAAKLDQELDDFIAGLEKRKYTEGWPEDRWQEEMEKHPFFMTKLPEDGKLPPLLEGIQQLKYDENENTPLDLAKSYKEDGNFNFKYKKYRMAVLSYTEGIRRHCGDPEIESQLYNNRAAAQFRLGNYKSCLGDCCKALKIKPDYVKVKLRAAECCVKLKMHKEAIKYCDEILQKEPEEPTALKLRCEAVATGKQEERDLRKKEMQEKKLNSQLVAIKTAIESRNIPVEVDGDILDSLEVSDEKPVLENGELIWLVFFVHPGCFSSDYTMELHENTTFFEHLVYVFDHPHENYELLKYKPEELAIYFEGSDRNKLYLVDVHQTLLQVFSCGKFVVRDWKPTFFVLAKGSSVESSFLKNYTVV